LSGSKISGFQILKTVLIKTPGFWNERALIFDSRYVICGVMKEKTNREREMGNINKPVFN
jgi:hypothetical protein